MKTIKEKLTNWMLQHKKLSYLLAVIFGVVAAFILMFGLNAIMIKSKKGEVGDIRYLTDSTIQEEILSKEDRKRLEPYYEVYGEIEKAQFTEPYKLKRFYDFKEKFWEVTEENATPEERKVLRIIRKATTDNPCIDEKKVKKYYKFRTGYITDVVNIRKKPSKKSKSLGLLLWNDEVTYRRFNRNWAMIEYQGGFAYVSLKYIRKDPFPYEEYETVTEHQKSYMDYRKITLTTSKQYKLGTNGYAYTGNYGIRMMHGRYLCAIGTYYSDDVGRYVDLVLENGTIIPCILGDIKADEDTDSTNRYTVHDHSVVEFIVDTPVLSSKVTHSGNLNYANPDWNSSIVAIRVYDKRI